MPTANSKKDTKPAPLRRLLQSRNPARRRSVLICELLLRSLGSRHIMKLPRASSSAGAATEEEEDLEIPGEGDSVGAAFPRLFLSPSLFLWQLERYLVSPSQFPSRAKKDPQECGVHFRTLSSSLSTKFETSGSSVDAENLSSFWSVGQTGRHAVLCRPKNARL